MSAPKKVQQTDRPSDHPTHQSTGGHEGSYGCYTCNNSNNKQDMFYLPSQCEDRHCNLADSPVPTKEPVTRETFSLFHNQIADRNKGNH